jgi:hypothetical protein
MLSYEVHGLRVSSSAVREALAAGDMPRAASLLGRPYAISGHVVHGRKLGRTLGFRTLNLRFGHAKPAAMGIFVVEVHGLGSRPLPGVASLGVRPTVEDAGRVLLETHCLDWPAGLPPEGAYGKLVSVRLLHKLHASPTWTRWPCRAPSMHARCRAASVMQAYLDRIHRLNPHAERHRQPGARRHPAGPGRRLRCRAGPRPQPRLAARRAAGHQGHRPRAGLSHHLRLAAAEGRRCPRRTA